MPLTEPEHEVLRLAIALVQETDPHMHLRALVREGLSTGLSPEAMGSLEEILSRGLARKLVLGGGSTAWASTPPLRFTSATLDLLHWLHTAPIAAPSRPPLILRSSPSAADALLFARALELMVAARSAPPPELDQPWVWVLAGQHLADAGLSPRLSEAQLVERLTPDRWLLRRSQRRLRVVWARWSRRVRAVDAPGAIEHGAAQEQIVRSLFSLAGSDPGEVAFLIDLLVEWAALPAKAWDPSRGDHAITVWQRARRARVALIRSIAEAAGAWETRWRSTGFIDDDYDEAQRQLRRFERGLKALSPLREVLTHAERLPEVT
ncbi:MAG TPA: hypothetical protein ENK18_12950 [Deltaproteobacteria bacterium]|nr:hypothetical protein [Deltaproteobacteria bacterium]